MLANLKYHMYIVFAVVFTLVSRLIPDSDLLVCSLQQPKALLSSSGQELASYK